MLKRDCLCLVLGLNGVCIVCGRGEETLPNSKEEFELNEIVQVVLEKIHKLQDRVEELENILKEAGIIVTPPKNISVPDPRGYSVNKIK